VAAPCPRSAATRKRPCSSIAVSGGEPARVTNDKEAELLPRWHPDGERILYNVFRNGFVQINLTTADGVNPPVPVTRGEGNYALVGISPDGSRVYYANAESKSDVSSINVVTRQEDEVASEAEVEMWTDASPDGKSIVYHTNSLPYPTARLDESELVIRSTDGQKRQLVSKGFDARWLPDSRHIALFRLAESMSEVWIVDTVTGKETRITTEDVMWPSYSIMPIAREYVRAVDFSPDSLRFAYLDVRKPGNLKISTLDGRDITSVTNNTNPNIRYFSPKFSRNGTQLAFMSVEKFNDAAQKAVWSVHVSSEAGVTTALSTTEGLRLVGWSGSGEVIVATAKRFIGDAPIDIDLSVLSRGGSIRRLITIEGIYGRTLALSLDGKAAAFTVRQGGRDDICTAAMTSGAVRRRITANSNSRLFLTNLVFSSDGKTIYFDKQEEINTISMFENFN